MTTSTLVLLVLSFGVAVGLSFFQYFYKVKRKSNVYFLLAFLRFLSIFSLCVLLINPIIKKSTFEIQKTPLPIVIDNSLSIKELHADQDVDQIIKKLVNNKALNEKFEVEQFQFDSDFELKSQLTFKGKQTNIEKVAKSLKSIYKNKLHPTVLISDGNATAGNDYVYAFHETNKVYPIILGDTTQFLDIKISQLNFNKYAFHKNKFPVEVFLNYAGKKNITTQFKITQGNTTLHSQEVSFSPSKNATVLQVLLPADKVGLQLYKAQISTSENEKNTYNNTKNFALEVLEQKSEIALISTINHPDLGAIKRAIESNVQRKVTIIRPNEIKNLSSYAILILYQPNGEFKAVFNQANQLSLNSFIVTGLQTDYNFLNQQQTNVQFKMVGQKEDYLAQYNDQFNLFALDNIGFEQFPPLENAFGSIFLKENATVLLHSRIKSITTNSPLMAFSETNGIRNAYLFGEGIWKWRSQSYLNEQNFEKFDVFVDKIVQYLGSNNAKKSLVVNHESYYNSGDLIEITAQYFNKNYEFDEKARLTISFKNKKNNKVNTFDFIRSNNAFKVNLEGLEAGNYTFTVKETRSNSSYQGFFEVIDFDIEKQFVNPDVERLSQVASQTKGACFMPNQVNALIENLLQNNDFKTIEKEIVKKSPLIEWFWLLIILAVSLASEWFIRKYNGMD